MRTTTIRLFVFGAILSLLLPALASAQEMSNAELTRLLTEMGKKLDAAVAKIDKVEAEANKAKAEAARAKQELARVKANQPWPRNREGIPDMG